MNKKVKVCGLTRPRDIRLAVSLGTDLVGFVVAPSKRSVSLEQLESLAAAVPATVTTVAVVVNPTREESDRILELTDRIQFHGDEAPEFCARYGRRAIKAFRIRQAADLDRVKAYESSVGAFLLDSFLQGQQGGTGHTFPWAYLEERTFPLPTFLAGGLKPENACQAVAVKSVVGLDLSSGLEEAPGLKNEELMRRFFFQVKGS